MLREIQLEIIVEATQQEKDSRIQPLFDDQRAEQENVPQMFTTPQKIREPQFCRFLALVLQGF